MCMHSHRRTRTFLSSERKKTPAKQKLKMNLFSRISGYVMNASVGGLDSSVSQGVTHILAKDY